MAVEPGIAEGSFQLTGCTVINNASGILVDQAGSHPLHDNIFCHNGTHDIRLQGVDDLDATDNWWCTTDWQEIAARIYDVYDDASLGQVIFTPYLLSPP